MIEFRDVTKILGGKQILNGISFRIDEGEIFVIVGPSGVGKSVTLKHMVRLMTPDSGEVIINGQDIVSMSSDGLADMRDLFGYLFQGGALLAWLTIGENVALPLREKTHMSDTEISDRIAEVLKMVGLEKDVDKMPDEVSGGMRKRAGLARAIIEKPRIILYDEPTSGLDPVTARTIDTLIEQLRAELGVTSVVVTHDLHSALSIGTKIAMLHSGGIEEISTPEDFIKSESAEVRKFLESQFITKNGSWERKL